MFVLGIVLISLVPEPIREIVYSRRPQPVQVRMESFLRVESPRFPRNFGEAIGSECVHVLGVSWELLRLSARQEQL